MERKLLFKISQQDTNHTIYDYLKAQGFSSQNIIDLKKMNRSILINQQWVHVNYRLNAGEELLIHIQENSSNDKIIPSNLPFPIIYEDEDIVVINKPADMPIHPSQNNYGNTLANAAAYYYEVEKNTPFIFRCINRLDRNTTGLTILAKNMYSAGVLAGQMQRREIKRLYLAVIDGHLERKYGTIRLPIGRKSGSTIERQIDLEHGENAITHYCRLRTIGNYTLAAFQLETGRTHQIRVHMASLNTPLIGDTLYNTLPSATALPRQALHAYRISFTHPVTKEHMKFTAPIPEDILSLI
ncbi:MAG: RluA family pseudouridine synthase [Lachnospiraceae bacterium]|nr:RluA family pseudouridine synthase [Lachnospiraceae bacterium]